MKNTLLSFGIFLVCIFSSSAISAGESKNLYTGLRQIAKVVSPLGIEFRKESPILNVASDPMELPNRKELEEESGFGAGRTVLAVYSCYWGRNYDAIVLVYTLAEKVQADILVFEKESGRFVSIENVYSEINVDGGVLISESKLSDYTHDAMPDLLVREYFLSSVSAAGQEEMTYTLYSWDGAKFRKFSAEGLEDEMLRPL